MAPESNNVEPTSAQNNSAAGVEVVNTGITITGGDIVTNNDVVVGANVEVGTDNSSSTVSADLTRQSTAPLTTQEKLSCIAKHATLYGISWSSESLSARNLFSRSNVALNYVDCGVDDCKSKGIVAYPTWKIDGTIYVGKMSLDELVSASGC